MMSVMFVILGTPYFVTISKTIIFNNNQKIHRSMLLLLLNDNYCIHLMGNFTYSVEKKFN